MSFTGDLEHLSIVDVVQLLHATRKSGTLTVTGRKGAAQLVFSDGFIVSANHFDERLRIGAILVGAGALAEPELGKALAEQKAAGRQRKPLIASLIESGRVKKVDAFRGLETLIELTIVDILTWKTGSFTLDVGAVDVADEYRYFPENLREDLHFNTENVLMEALRIYDEKKRDGKLQDREPEAEAANAGDVLSLTEEAGFSLSPDDLGLADVEGLERRIPGVFAPIEDRPVVSPHRAELRAAAPDLSEEDLTALAHFLENPGARPPGLPGLPLAVILLGADALLAHCLAAVCRHEGLALFATTDPEDVGPFADHQRGKGRVPMLVVDRDEQAGADRPGLGHRHLGTIELAAATDAALGGGAGIRTVLPRPPRHGRSGPFVADMVRFLAFFPALLRDHAREQGAWAATAARLSAARLGLAGDAAGVARAVLASVSELGARSLALVARGAELVSAGGAGLHQPGMEPAPMPAIRIALDQAPLLRDAVGAGRCLIAPADEAVRAAIDAAIGAPADPTAMFLPLAASGRTVSVIYADFGPGAAAPPPEALLETIAAQAAAALELVLCRRKLEKLSR